MSNYCVNKKTTEEFIRKLKTVHGDKYDYSNVNYVNNKTHVILICPNHGKFSAEPRHLLEGQGCKECFKERQSKAKTLTQEQFIEKANKIHNNKYDYSITNYSGYRKDIDIICPIHGKFTQNAGDHLRGCGCKECGKKIMWDNRGRETVEEFVEKAKLLHGDRYDYSKVKYIDAKKPVTIICKKHGEFIQTPSNHLLNCGCPKCAKSKMVNEVIKILDKNNIKYTLEQTFDWLTINGNKLRLDIFLPDYSTAIECQGKQHFEPIEYWGGLENLKKTKQYDEIKYNLCEKNNIKILYYTNLKNINEEKTIYKNITDLLKFLKNE